MGWWLKAAFAVVSCCQIWRVDTAEEQVSIACRKAGIAPAK